MKQLLIAIALVIGLSTSANAGSLSHILEPSNTDLMNEIQELKNEIQELKNENNNVGYTLKPKPHSIKNIINNCTTWEAKMNDPVAWTLEKYRVDFNDEQSVYKQKYNKESKSMKRIIDIRGFDVYYGRAQEIMLKFAKKDAERNKLYTGKESIQEILGSYSIMYGSKVMYHGMCLGEYDMSHLSTTGVNWSGHKIQYGNYAKVWAEYNK